MSLEMSIDKWRYVWRVMEQESLFLGKADFDKHIEIQLRIQEEILRLATESREWFEGKEL